MGDCAAWTAGPGLAKAGVYAVRQGPVLAHNLMARIRGERLRAYRPQRDFLSLLNLGDGARDRHQVGRLGRRGRPVFSLKDWIDRRFVRRFQVLDPGRRGHAGLRRVSPCPAGTCSAAAARPRWANPR